MQTIEEYTDSVLNPDQTNWKQIAQNSGWAIYYMVILYAASHTLSWVQHTLTGFFLGMGYIGALGVSANAIVLPRAIKEWTLDTWHRLAAIVFYAIDFAGMLGFVWMNSNLERGIETPAVTQFAVNYAPIVFVIPGLTWAVLFIMDPEAVQRHKAKRAMQKAMMIELNTQSAIKVIEAKQRANAAFQKIGPVPEFKIPEPTPETGFFPGLNPGQKIRIPEPARNAIRNDPNHSGNSGNESKPEWHQKPARPETFESHKPKQPPKA